MITYLFYWNPSKWAWVSRQNDIQACVPNHRVVLRWSVSEHVKLAEDVDGLVPGHHIRAFLYITAQNQKGIIGHGKIFAHPFEDLHYNPARAQNGDTLFYAYAEFERLENAPFIHRQQLVGVAQTTFAHMRVDSGIRLNDADAQAVWDLLQAE